MSSTPEKLLEQLAETPEFSFPGDILEEIKARKEEMIPAMLALLGEAAKHPRKYEAGTSWIPFVFSIYLLAEFRLKAAFPLITHLLSLPEEEVEALFSDMIVSDMGKILASVYDGNETLLRNLIENPRTNEYVRSSSVIQAYLCLMHSGQMSQQTVHDYFTELVQHRLEREYAHVWSALCSTCGDLGLVHLLPDIEQAFAVGWCDPMFDRLESIQKRAKAGGAKRWDDTEYLIKDAESELKCYPYFNKPAVSTRRPTPTPTPTPIPVGSRTAKVGRNDPCPCQSGKKYKKCCGAGV